ncbi:MAG: DEAD/DEAH box helicase family protein, partial [Candidatus Heimdallarchaeota archaeon]|nr:DEAD/DEAH box helicase family protein [Candidatus Heimdallarchaeota archaeon]
MQSKIITHFESVFEINKKAINLQKNKLNWQKNLNFIDSMIQLHLKLLDTPDVNDTILNKIDLAISSNRYQIGEILSRDDCFLFIQYSLEIMEYYRNQGKKSFIISLKYLILIAALISKETEEKRYFSILSTGISDTYGVDNLELFILEFQSKYLIELFSTFLDLLESHQINHEQIQIQFYRRFKLLFPYSHPRVPQFQIIQALLSLSNNSSLVVESGTGTGKSLASLASLLARKQKHQKILIYTRTISQMEPLIREYIKIMKHIQNEDHHDISDLINLKSIPVLGKNRLCPFIPEFKLRLVDFQVDQISKFCNEFPFYQGKCKLNKQDKIKTTMLFKLMNKDWQQSHTYLDDYTQILLKSNKCPYYIQEQLISQAEIVIVPYMYMELHKLNKIVKQMKIKKYDLLILVDEAHNILKETVIACSLHFIDILIQYLTLEFPFKMVDFYDLHQYIKNPEKQLEESKIKELRSLTRILDKSDMVELMNKMAEYYKKEVEQIKMEFDSFREILQNSLGLIYCSPTHLYYIEMGSDRTKHLQEASIQVYQSATISPIQYSTRLYNLNNYKYIKTSSSQQTIILQTNIGGLTSKYT